MKNKWIILFFIPIIFYSASAYYLYQEQTKKTDFITDMALAGNPTAIAIIRKYDKPYSLEFRVVKQAIQGNGCAKLMLKLDEEQMIYIAIVVVCTFLLMRTGYKPYNPFEEK